jgi:hypothetical protein
MEKPYWGKKFPISTTRLSFGNDLCAVANLAGDLCLDVGYPCADVADFESDLTALEVKSSCFHRRFNR